MKKAISLCICLLIFLGSLIPNSRFEELIKVNDLIKHYKIHQKTDLNLSFIAFLVDHYLDSSSSKNTPEHSKLPFFQHDFANFVFILIHNSFYIFIEEKLEPIFYSPFLCKYMFSVAANPFRPPQNLF